MQTIKSDHEMKLELKMANFWKGLIDMSKKCSNKQFWLHFSAHWALSHKTYIFKKQRWTCLNCTIDEIPKNKNNNLFVYLKVYIHYRRINPV